jgi:hypothetical protein
VRLLADNGTSVLAEDDGRLLFFRRRILPSWAAFVPALLAVIAIGNGAVQLAVGNVVAGGVLLAIGMACGLGWRAVVARRRRAREAPLEPTDALVVLDLAQGRLFDVNGDALAPLDTVRIDRAMQATSSARSLRVTWPGGRVVVYRGDPFARHGSMRDAVDALQARGVTVSG